MGSLGWLTRNQVKKLGFDKVGKNVLIDDTAVFHGAEAISIGSNSRIDGFTLLSAGGGAIDIHRNVHLASHVRVNGGAGIVLECCSGLSSGVTVHSLSDDFTTGFLRHPTLSPEFRRVTGISISFGPFSAVGANSVVLPGGSLGFASSAGALVKVNFPIPDFTLGMSFGDCREFKLSSHEIASMASYTDQCESCRAVTNGHLGS